MKTMKNLQNFKKKKEKVDKNQKIKEIKTTFFFFEKCKKKQKNIKNYNSKPLKQETHKAKTPTRQLHEKHTIHCYYVEFYVRVTEIWPKTTFYGQGVDDLQPDLCCHVCSPSSLMTHQNAFLPLLCTICTLSRQKQALATSKPIRGLCSMKRRDGSEEKKIAKKVSQVKQRETQRNQPHQPRMRENIESSAHSMGKPVARPTPAPKYREYPSTYSFERRILEHCYERVHVRNILLG